MTVFQDSSWLPRQSGTETRISLSEGFPCMFAHVMIACRYSQCDEAKWNNGAPKFIALPSVKNLWCLLPSKAVPSVQSDHQSVSLSSHSSFAYSSPSASSFSLFLCLSLLLRLIRFRFLTLPLSFLPLVNYLFVSSLPLPLYSSLDHFCSFPHRLHIHLNFISLPLPILLQLLFHCIFSLLLSSVPRNLRIFYHSSPQSSISSFFSSFAV